MDDICSVCGEPITYVGYRDRYFSMTSLERADECFDVDVVCPAHTPSYSVG